MLKVLAALRTIFLIFILVYTVRAMPWSFGLPSDSAEAYNICRTSLRQVTIAGWLAIAWIALETAVGWWMATRPPKLRGEDIPRDGEPPFAPPPHS